MLALASFSTAQNAPSSIRGYKLYRTKVQVRNAEDKNTNDEDAIVKVGVPRVVDVGFDAVVLEAAAEISGFDQDGQVDALMFKDVVVNGVPLRVDDYGHPFQLKKGASVMLPVPVRGSVSTLNVAKVAVKEATASRDEWQVTGTVFVFGRFKKMGFTFKRVIPVTITLMIANPLKPVIAAAVDQ